VCLHLGVLCVVELCQSQSQSYVTTDGQSAHLGLKTRSLLLSDGYRLFGVVTVTGFLVSGALSDERTGLSFARVTVRSSTSFVSMHNLHFTCY
jgi:hypothetical protein